MVQSSSSQLILAGDVGGTNTRVQVWRRDGVRLVPEGEPVTHREMPAIDAVRKFIDEENLRGRIVGACLGVAGKVTRGRAAMTNRPGETVDESSLADAIGIAVGRVRLVNDMVAHAAACGYVEEAVIQCGEAADADVPVIGLVMPGTGLGIGMAVEIDDQFVGLPSEGGHVDFAPPTEDFDWLLPAMRQRTGGRVSYENIVSGTGLPTLYECVCERDGVKLEKFKGEQITAAAIGKDSPADPDRARAVCNLFEQLVGARAGNVLVQTLCTAGIYLGGAICKMLRAHDPAGFDKRVLDAFHSVGPDALRPTFDKTPVKILLETESGLAGAARLARRLATS